MKKINCVIFDIGNVLVKWSPEDIVKATFGDDSQVEYHVQRIFKHDIWYSLNLGKLTEQEAIVQYNKILNYDINILKLLFNNIKHTQNLYAGTVEMLKQLYTQNYQLYALSDNILEVVAYLKQRYDFWQYFNDIIISAEVGLMKPSHEIFKLVLKKHKIKPKQSIFIDDYEPNVNAAQDLGMNGICFISPEQCKRALSNLGINL